MTAAPRYPHLIDGLPVLRRGEHQWQIGLENGRAVILDGITEEASRWLRQLDGKRSAANQIAAAQRFGLDREQAARTLELLSTAGVIWMRESHEARAELDVRGESPLAAAIRQLARESGVADSGLTIMAADWALPSAADIEAGDELSRLGRAHLVVAAGASVVRIGPLVSPGSTPCLRCEYLARIELDPQWAQLAWQLGHGLHGGCPGADRVRIALAAALAVQRVRGWQSMPDPGGTGARLPGGQILEWDSAGVASERQVRLHPACGCWWR